VLSGASVTDSVELRGALRFPIRVGEWPSGLYTARVGWSGGEVHAPFVVRPRRLGERRIAVVLPTNTWQAYNFLDVDGDGIGDTWYASPHVRSVDLARPFLDGGIPPHFRGYDHGFLRWLALRGHRVDVLSDDDLDDVRSGDELSRLYHLVVFPGHEEYVTTQMFDVVERFHELGGNLLFLSANNFFYRVERDGTHIVKNGRWRDLGRPEARFAGVQYVDWNRGVFANRPFVVTDTGHAPWLFARSGMRNGSQFGHYGIEIDARCADSPPGVRVLATIRDAFGAGKTAEMAYHETPRGGKVFSAGVINFGGSALWPGVRTLLDNLWMHMGRR
jgi:hypothetical protein